jgi:carbamoyltransferase
VRAPFEELTDDEVLCRRVAELIAAGKVVGWFQGRMEFGPRALGARSILGDARNPAMQSVMNLKIKFRESFRPFAPAVLQDRVHDYFETRPHESSPYMLIVAPVQPGHRTDGTNGQSLPSGLDKLKIVRSDIPAVTHVDYSARIQTVDATRHGRFYRLLKSFEALTGCPVLINTSFNVRGEPIVCRPDEAYRCFLATDIDVLVLDNFVLDKQRQPKLPPAEVDGYLKQFSLD